MSTVGKVGVLIWGLRCLFLEGKSSVVHLLFFLLFFPLLFSVFCLLYEANEMVNEFFVLACPLGGGAYAGLKAALVCPGRDCSGSSRCTRAQDPLTFLQGTIFWTGAVCLCGGLWPPPQGLRMQSTSRISSSWTMSGSGPSSDSVEIG